MSRVGATRDLKIALSSKPTCVCAFIRFLQLWTAVAIMKLPLELASMHLVDVVIVDYLVPEMNGQEVAIKLRRFMPEAPIIMLSAAIDVAEQVLNLVNVFLAKDSLATQLLPMIAQLHRCGSTPRLRMMHDDRKKHATRRPPTPCLRGLPWELRHPASFRRLFSRDSWLFPGR